MREDVCRIGPRESAAVAALLLAALAAPCVSTSLAVEPVHQFTPAEVLVRFGPNAEPEVRSRLRAELGASVADALPVPGLQLLELPPGTPVADAVAKLERAPRVLYAEPNLYRKLRVVPDDPFFTQLWGLSNQGQVFASLAGPPTQGTADADVDAPEAWDFTTGSRDVTVAVGDSGVAYRHPDLQANIDPRGADLLSGSGDFDDREGHGTRVAGLIGARGNNGIGVTGMSWQVSLMPLRIGESGISAAAAVRSYAYAAAHGVPIYNGSFGDPTPSQAERDAITAASKTLFVFAADNGGADGSGDNSDAVGDFPCAYPLPNIVCVGASDRHDGLAAFSNYGRATVDLAAPGESVGSTISSGPGVAGGDYGPQSGTSFAAPSVSGAAALYLARYPSATVADVRAALLGGVDVKPAFAALASGGRLNARGTLAIPPAVAPTASAGPGGMPRAEDGRPAPAVAQPKPRRPGTLGLARGQSLRTVLRRGLRARITCPGPCRATARLALDGSTARQLGLPRVIGTGSARLTRAGAVGVTIRLRRPARARLARSTRVAAALRIELVQPGGERTRLERSLALAR